MSRDLPSVSVVLLAASLSPLLVIGPAQQLGVDPSTLQGSRFQITPTHLGLLLAFAALSCAIPLAACRWLHRRPLTLRSADGAGGWHLLHGLALGAALAGCAQGLAMLCSRGVRITWAVPPEVGTTELIASYALFLIAILALSSLKEELLYRAYPLQILGARGDRWPALLLSAALFSATHLVLEPPSLRGFVFRLLFGVLAGQVYLQQRSLWAAIGVHSGWNWVSGSLSGSWRVGGLWQLQIDSQPPLADWIVPATLLLGISWLESHACRGRR